MTTALCFNGVQLFPVTRNNQPWIKSTELARALGYKDESSVARIFQRNADEFSNDMSQTVKLTVRGLPIETRIFSLRGCHLLAMFARTPVAKAFRKWVLDVLDSLAAQEQPRHVQLELPMDANSHRKSVIAQIDKLRDDAEKGFSFCQTMMQFCQPGCPPRSAAPSAEREAYDTMMELYRMARENMAAAYNAIVLGYRVARQYGRV